MLVKYIRNGQGNQVLPITHVSAVRDNQGNTLTTLLAAKANSSDVPAAQIQSDWDQTDNTAKDYIKNKPTIPTIPTNVSTFTNDAGYLTSHQSIAGKADKIAVASTAPANGLLPETMYTLGTIASMTLDTTGTDDGYMHEWMATFTPSSSSFTFTPAVTFPSGSSITANKVNEVNIKRVGSTYYGLVASWG